MSQSLGGREEEIDPAVIAAITAAVDQAWPRAVIVTGQDMHDEPPRWRFSGRWWSRPVPSRRIRPWS